MKVHPTLYPLKQKDICDYNSRCFISNGLMFDDIIMSMNVNNELDYHVEIVDNYFKKIVNNIIFMYKGSLQKIYSKKGTHKSLDVAFLNVGVERMQIIQYFTNILKYDTSSYYMK